ncbi:MAG: tetratricopeptide repeat protein [Deltaproteobacteria bacterium]|nr:tetratricopeptide repeat protein [Deltaproteobacteria bacterium]
MYTSQPKSNANGCMSAVEGECDDAIADSFFRGPLDSAPPVVETLVDDEDEPILVQESAQQVARRSRLRKVVGLLLGGAGLFAIFGVARTALCVHGSAVEVRAASAPAALADKPRPVVAGTAQDTVPKVTPAAPAPEAAAPDEVAAAAPDEEEEDAMPDPVQGADLRKQATAQLERGRYREAIESARAATVADPSHATAWLLLGSALQSTGKWKEGVEAYSRCAQMAARGPVWECRAMGGR